MCLAREIEREVSVKSQMPEVRGGFVCVDRNFYGLSREVRTVMLKEMKISLPKKRTLRHFVSMKN